MSYLSNTIQFLICIGFTLAISTLCLPQNSYAQTPETSQEEQTHTADVQTAPPQHNQSFKIPKNLQTELPQEEAIETPKDPNLPDWLKNIAVFIKYIFYGILIFCVLFLVYMVVREIMRIRRNRAPEDEPQTAPPIPAYQPDAETARIVLDDADKLASEGRFTEAVHTLLFRSIQDIEDKRPHHVNTSLTSREISNLPILTQAARSGFSMINRLVEASFFGGNNLTLEDYNQSKSAYKTFAFEKIDAK